MKGKKKSIKPKKVSKNPSRKILCDKKSELKNKKFNEQNFRILFDKALDGMLLVDIKTKKFLMANKAICKILGYSEKELINLSVSDLHPREQLKHVLKQFGMQAKGNIVLASNIPVLKKDRTIFYAGISASPVQISGKKYLLGIFRDTTERKMLTEKLEAEKEIAQLYLDIAGVMFIVIGADQKVKLANKKACQTLGYTEKQVIGSNWFDKFIPDHIRKNVKETFSKLMSGEIKSVEYFENPVLTRSGKEKIIAWHNTILRDKKGIITGTLSSGSDITELKKIEESLIHSEKKYRSFFTSVPVGWAYCKVVLDNKNKPEDYIFLEVNNAFEELTGLKKENILGKKATKVIPQIKKTHWIEKFGNVAVTGKPVKGETYLEPFNKWYSLYVSCPQKGYFIKVLEDINSRKKFEKALLESEEKYRLLNESIPVVVYSALPDKYSTNIFLSGRVKELTGYTPEEFLTDPQLWDRIIFDEDKPQVWESIEKHRAKKTLLHVEYRIVCKNGSIKWIKDMATPALDEQGKLIRIDGFMENITERKTAEEALRESEEKYRTLFEESFDGLFITSPGGKILDMNKKGILMFGYDTKEEILSLDLEHDVYAHPPDRKRILTMVNAQGFAEYDVVVKKKNGETMITHCSLTAVKDKDGKITSYRGIIRDITERKKADEALKFSETRYRRLFESAKDGILILDADSGQIMDVNPYLIEMLGYSHEEFLGKKLWEIGLFKDIAESKTKFQKLQTEKYIRYKHLPLQTTNGQTIDVEFVSNTYKVNHKAVIQCNIRNITERYQAEERLNAAYKKLENIIEFLPDATVIVDADKKIIAWNRSMEDMTGIRKKDMLGKDHIHVATPFYGKPKQYLIDLLYMDNAEIVSKYSFVIKKGDTFYAETFTPALFNGKGAYVWAIAAPLYDTDGNMIGAIESIRDITDRKQAEEEIQKSKKQLQIIFDTSHAGIIQIDPHGKIILANKRMVQMLGYGTEKLIGSSYIDYIHPSHKEHANKMILSLINGSVDNIDTERLYIKENGAEFWGHIAARRITEPDGRLTGILVIISDITERKRLEEELMHSQKIEAVGQLAGGIAHDFNNILNAIIGYGSLLKMKMKEDDPLQQNVKQILESADRAAELTHNLLAFSRKEIMNFKPVELNEILKHVEKFLKSLIEENIELTIKKSGNALNILADRGHLEQVIIHLATNARDAMPDGGQLIISTESMEIDRNYIEAHNHGEVGHYAVLSVTDTGTGMSKETQEKIFDPFFTTKEVNKGTGLGLPMVYGIIKQHKGFTNVYSEVGKGTCFKIYLPLTQFEKAENVAALAHRSSSLRGTETVLVAEDDQYLRNFSEAVLAEFGYNAISAKDGEEAVKKFLENKATIDICVFDVIMPRKSGIEAFKEIQKIKPDIKILFTSGYTSDFISRYKLPEKEFTILPKPFKPEVLLLKIRDILDKQSAM